MCIGVFLLGFVVHWALCASWIWVTISFPKLGKFLTIISSNIFSDPFFFPSFGTLIIWILVQLMLSQRSLRLSSVLFILFPLFCSLAVISTILSSSSLIHSSASVILLLIPSSIFFISIFGYYLFKYFLRPSLSFFSFWDPCNVNVGAFNIDPEVS